MVCTHLNFEKLRDLLHRGLHYTEVRYIEVQLYLQNFPHSCTMIFKPVGHEVLSLRAIPMGMLTGKSPLNSLRTAVCHKNY